MFGTFLLAIAKILHIVFTIYIWIIIFRAILSWIRIPSLYPVAVILYKLTEPVLKPLRKLVPPYKVGGLDISPMIAVILILFLDSFIVKSLIQIARQIATGNTYYF